ncbi:DNA cross-link repair 1A protein (DCR1A) [Vairimorpha necatrix]|uniref:DNA cross-link repair 1A protein (DCR1A) n=1 Tax=Vairimorpha necatrix TaxID=6039 RepID=A0AAX4JAN5_9MICR
MFLLKSNAKIGKIFQIFDFDDFILHNPNILIICTFKNLDHQKTMVACDSLDLSRILLELLRSPEDILIYSMSTINITNKIYNYMQILNCKGFNIFVHTFTDSKSWYADLKNTLLPMDIYSIPRHKKIPFTDYVVDCFNLEISNASHYFLSHFHADHYGGLKKSFPHTIYCSNTTANLIDLKFKCKTTPLENNVLYHLGDNNTVYLIDANHCPGAVCFIFSINGHLILHTGDFRCTFDLTSHLLKYKFNTIFLDNTFEGFRSFPSQEVVIHGILDTIRNHKNTNCLVPINYKYLFCTYSIGKEKIFLCVAHYFNMSVKVEYEKMRIYKCYDQEAIDRLNNEVERIVNNYRSKTKPEKTLSEIKTIKRTIKTLTVSKKKSPVNKSESILKYCKKPTPLKEKTNIQTENIIDANINSGNIIGANINSEDIIDANINSGNIQTHSHIRPFSRITTENTENQVMVISTQHTEKKRLHKILDTVKADRVAVFCGTGWRDTTVSFDWLKADGRKVKKGIDIFYTPYSEHSSSDELEYFRENMKYDRILNTVKNKNSSHDVI